MTKNYNFLKFFFNDSLFLKLIRFNKNIYRRNYIKVSYKNKKTKYVSLSLSSKNLLKQNVQKFNHHLKKLTANQ